jgi:hypothetical protein
MGCKGVRMINNERGMGAALMRNTQVLIGIASGDLGRCSRPQDIGALACPSHQDTQITAGDYHPHA